MIDVKGKMLKTRLAPSKEAHDSRLAVIISWCSESGKNQEEVSKETDLERVEDEVRV